MGKCEKCGQELPAEAKEEATKELVIKRLKEGYYKFSAEEANKEFRADLKAINFNLREADLWEADLREADLREADLWKANLWKANLREADLRKANLREANLWKANLWKANLRKADLRKADLNAIFWDTKVTKKQRKYIMEETDLFDIEGE